MKGLSKTEANRLRAQVHSRRAHQMPCGQEVRGNGGKHSHQNRCRDCLTQAGAYMPDSVRQGIALNMAGGTVNERLEAYATWRREEGDRLLAKMTTNKERQ